MFAQASESIFQQLLNRIAPDFLGVIGLVSVVLVFAFLIVSTITICRTIQNIWIVRMQNQIINELLAKGYTAEEIQQLVTGKRRNVLFRFFDRAQQSYVNRPPAPPVKTTL